MLSIVGRKFGTEDLDWFYTAEAALNTLLATRFGFAHKAKGYSKVLGSGSNPRNSYFLAEDSWKELLRGERVQLADLGISMDVILEKVFDLRLE